MFSRISIKRPVATVMVLIITIMAGLVACFSLKMDLMPNVDMPIAVVSTTYVGAGPEEVETLITKPVESALSTVTNVDSIQSVSSANSSMVIVTFINGTDLDMASLDMREKVDMIKDYLPDGAEEPMVLKIDINSLSGISVGIDSDKLSLKELNTLVEEEIVSRFEKIEGVASVSITGGITEEIQVVVNPEKMAGYGISESTIASMLAAENLNTPAGSLKQGSTKLTVKSEGEFESIEEIAEMPLMTNYGAIIHLRDVAEVKLVDKEMESYALIDGNPGVMLYIQKQSDANIVDVSEELVKEIEKVSRDYGQINIQLLTDTADYIKFAVGNMVTTAFQAAFLAIFVVFAFLRSGRMSFIIGVSIPTSIIATFALMWSQDMTMNMISMGGLTIGIGMLVDNSIVVLENIYQKMRLGMEPKEASAQGANEVAMAVAASTLTTMGVFVPLMFVNGVAGQMMKDLSLTICFSLFASLIVSLTFVPMACSKLLKTEAIAVETETEEELSAGLRNIPWIRKVFIKWAWALNKLDVKYREVLHFAIRNKKKVAVGTVIFFVATMLTLFITGFDFMPEMDEGSATIEIDMPDGSVIAETEEIVGIVIDRISDIEEIDYYYASVGGGLLSSGTDSASVGVTFVSKKDRKKSSQELAMEIEEDLQDIPGCQITVSASMMAMGSLGGSTVDVRLKGDDADILRETAYEVERIIEGIEGVAAVENSAGEPVPEAQIKIDRGRASVYGITSGQVAGAVATAINGTVATEFKTNGTEIDVRIKQSTDKIEYMQDILSIPITSPVTGAQIPLNEVADIVMGESAVSITRANGHKYIDVTAEVYDRDISSVQKDIDELLADYNFKGDITYEYTGIMETMIESFQQLALALLIAIALVYMIMAAQFESLLYPFIIMFSVPIALTGGVLGLFVTGETITVVAFMGFIMLAGMVVNNAIVLIDAANQNVAKGMDYYEAIETAGPDRLRPILMTTLTTVLGMVPMWLSNAEGMELQKGMSVVIIFGLTLSTVVTLVFIPTLYVFIEEKRRKKLNLSLKRR